VTVAFAIPVTNVLPVCAAVQIVANMTQMIGVQIAAQVEIVPYVVLITTDLHIVVTHVQTVKQASLDLQIYMVASLSKLRMEVVVQVMMVVLVACA
jgi:hypothetical protein